MRLCEHYGPQEMGSLVWCCAVLRVMDLELLEALSRHVTEGLGPRELGVMGDAVPFVRPRLLPWLQERAAEGYRQLQRGGELDLITFGALGSCEVLKHGGIKASTADLGLQLRHKQVLCRVEYRLGGVEGQLQRRNRAESLDGLRLPNSPVDRSACAEYRALGALEALGLEPKGQVQLSVSEPPCVACLQAMLAFQRQRPEVSMQVRIDGRLLRFGRELEKLGGSGDSGGSRPRTS